DSPGLTPALGNVEQLAPLEKQRLPEARQRNLLIELRVADGDRRLVDQDRQQVTSLFIEEQRLLAFKAESAELSLLVLEQEAEKGPQARLAEDRAKLFLGLGPVGGDLAVVGLGDGGFGAGEEDPLQEVVHTPHTRILAIDLGGSRDRPEPEPS